MAEIVAASKKEGKEGTKNSKAGDKKDTLKRPNKDDRDKAIEELKAEIKALNDRSTRLKAEKDRIVNSRTGTKPELDAARAIMNALNVERRLLNQEKSQLIIARNESKAKQSQVIEEEKKIKGDLRAKDVGEVDVKIRELEAKQNTTSMPLQEEKKLLKEIANLKASKQGFAQLTTLREARERNKSVMDELMIRSNDNHSKIQEVNSKLTEQREVCDKLTKEKDEIGSKVPDINKELSDIREAIAAKNAEISAVRDAFTEKEKEFQAYFKEQQEKRRAEENERKLARKLEEEAREKEREEEELKKIPYLEEITLCENLEAYLEKLSLSIQDETSVVAKSTSSSGKKDDDEDDVYISKSKKGKKKAAKKVETFKHSISSIDSFGRLSLVPPITMSEVPSALEAVKAKKSFYQTQERGAVPTIKDIQSAEENKAAKKEKKKPDVSLGVDDFPGL